MLESVLNADGKTTRRNPRAGRDTREEILNCAEELLQRRGYNAFSYQHIAVQLGIRNAAIHYHFATKETLGVALVQRYRQRFRDWCIEVAQLKTAADRLQAHFGTYADYLAAQCRICPSGVLGTDFEAIPEEMRHEARLFMREIYDWLVEVLDEGRASGALHFEGDSRHKALVIGAALQGALQIARMTGQERFHQIVAQLRLELVPMSADSPS